MKIFALFFVVSNLFAQTAETPAVSNAKFETRVVSGDLTTALRASEPTWFGYAIKTVNGDHDGCCFDGNRQSGCSLEENRATGNHYAGTSLPAKLEGSNAAAVLFRIENNQVNKVRLFSMACPLDAGGRRFIWLTDVRAEASLRYLDYLVKTSSSNQVQDGAVFAIAQHDASRADDILDELTRPSEPARLREQVTFWLGASRGARGVTILKRIVENDSSEQVRDKAVFALSISKQPEATDILLMTAKRDPSPHLRSQALFWIAQKAGTKATAALSNAVENDPNVDVKKQAVFAMSQLPKDEGVPKLIEIARTQRDPEVRKQAFFWLGQSNDPRALAFLEQVLVN